MKTTINFRKTAQVLIATAILFSTVHVTRTIIKNVKHQYSMLPAGSGRACFYDIIE
jgi:hypothetical protein